MNRVVVDSSALLALIQGEIGADSIDVVLRRSVISAVNLAEVYSKLTDRGQAALAAGEMILGLLAGVEPFTEEQARTAGRLRENTREHGLSIGDRACLALALSLGAAVYTADQAWANVGIGCEIHLIRMRPTKKLTE